MKTTNQASPNPQTAQNHSQQKQASNIPETPKALLNAHQNTSAQPKHTCKAHLKTMTLFIAASALTLASCQSEPKTAPQDPRTAPATTHMNVRVILPQNTQNAQNNVRAFNDDANFAGANKLVSMDVYITTDDRKTMLFARRFTKANDELTFGTAADGSDQVSLKDPIKTTAGSRWFFLVINNAAGLPFTTPPSDSYWSFNSALTSLDRIAKVDVRDPANNINNQLFPGETVGFDIFPDIITMSGAPAASITIVDGATQQDALTGAKNSFTVKATRLASRVIVTKTATADPVDVKDINGNVLGQVSNITYSVAQGCRDVYLFPNFVPNTNDPQTPAYSYVPGTNYTAEANGLFSYNDLANTADAVPTLPAKKYLYYLPGKFLLENTHASGVDATTSSYRQGNTAYVLVRTTFKPAKFTDTGTPEADGTFYVGESDYKVYTSVKAAQDGSPGGSGEGGQGVFKYAKGKVLYIAWLNPDNINRPFNSPVVRNNIYHINIKGFKQIGINWNPLVPDPSPGTTPNNPDPKPGDNPTEPDLPINPNNPLSSSDTYLDLNAEILPWSTHSYETEL